MNNEELLEQLKHVIREEVTTSENRVKSDLRQEIQASEERLTQKIAASQEDTIDTLSEVIHKGFNIHEERIATLEEHAGIQNPNKN